MDPQNTDLIPYIDLAMHQFKCINAYASVYTYLALISPFLKAKSESEKPNNGCTQMHCIN